EANLLVSKLERIFSDLDSIRGRLKTLKGKMDVLEMIWGEEIHAETTPDHREYAHYLEEVEQAKKEFDSTARKIQDLEGVVKSVEQGLVDFYGVIEGRLVFLCWKRGEKSIDFYHHLEDGFQGRMPLPTEEPAR
ncbi:MAG TPA: DUF2203 domain-containing protein, partial [Planctomycetota bacterium]|nr:DUF2203 domain-containing protein [Planctomycetota bacterium]